MTTNTSHAQLCAEIADLRQEVERLKKEIAHLLKMLHGKETEG